MDVMARSGHEEKTLNPRGKALFIGLCGKAGLECIRHGCHASASFVG